MAARAHPEQQHLRERLREAGAVRLEARWHASEAIRLARGDAAGSPARLKRALPGCGDVRLTRGQLSR